MTIPKAGHTLVEVVPFQKTFEEVRNNPFCILYTSGSTGIPKPVPVRYGSYDGMDSQLLIPSLGNKPTFLSNVQGKMVFFALPEFHGASLNWTAGIALFAGVTCVSPHPMSLTANLASQVFQRPQSYGAIMVPSLVVDYYNNDTYCRIRLMTLMGPCEMALLPHQMLDGPRDWECISLSPCLSYTFRDWHNWLGNLTIVRQKKYGLHQGVFSTFPQKEEHALGDSFEPHPLKPDLWRLGARADDILSFTTVEKLNPSGLESIIPSNSLVTSAVIGEEGAFLDQVWPSIVQANCDFPAHGRIMKSFVIRTDPANPLPRASKDTVQRLAVFKLYEAEWKSLYERRARCNQTSKEPGVQSSVSSRKLHGNPSQTDDGAVLSDKMTLAIESIVELKVSAALDRFFCLLRCYTRNKGSDEGVASSGGVVNGAVSVLNTTKTHGIQPSYFAKRANGQTKESPDGWLRQRIDHTLAENVEVDHLKDDTDLVNLGLIAFKFLRSSIQLMLSLLNPSSQVDLIQSEAILSNPTVAKLVAVVVQ
ncbi:uncharacterized protein BP5553_02687 [Venustampulla echinocandica]|uniref:AMP-dependent synthetase/ligase domain-containing protein n=1 Tax=Venustampulla echinocandica TaxID=2656787 RepID=A0A370TS41_9HELO|nr:uncharacterized protein BP5553_02687 [Venustampulla echinocandica]RDL38347.1 hypothetical protein BP5553_02687 [Venustampulla echinocandica]